MVSIQFKFNSKFLYYYSHDIKHATNATYLTVVQPFELVLKSGKLVTSTLDLSRNFLSFLLESIAITLVIDAAFTAKSKFIIAVDDASSSNALAVKLTSFGLKFLASCSNVGLILATVESKYV
jgi:hypothetical protein